ncbi:nicotinate phosphoribosyltransferase [Treponema parvum]|uniref:nicotinate phosphoribosyltransferase n=1 Tax=Treponema parvum TaxID=138851 RepID=UPI001AEBE18E|nr:nicotinate phosphoribosyltransferase [Treponema parvum]QTQ16449.1 nicotinate phosphoribosyltransferase [Treponema parvum]
MEQIITSLLDTDLYKFSMGQFAMRRYGDANVEWKFVCRTKDVHFTAPMISEIKRQLELYCKLNFTVEEINYLSSIKWLDKGYISFLSVWHPMMEHFIISDDADCGLNIRTVGPWFLTIYYETPVLSIVNEVYYSFKYKNEYDKIAQSAIERTKQKIADLGSKKYVIGSFSEFGTRRRLNFHIQLEVIRMFKQADQEGRLGSSQFNGTSNVMIAMRENIRPIGTMAHEVFMVTGQGYPERNPAYSNKFVMDEWHDLYGIQLGIALTDCITTDCFLLDFDIKNAMLFAGVRNDSGDPFEWARKMIAHYKKLGIDPKTKTLLFSDNLDFDMADKIYREFGDQARVSFGIGTFLVNDTYVPPLNIVMKTVQANGIPVVKISDSPGKGIGEDKAYEDYLQRAIDWRISNR